MIPEPFFSILFISFCAACLGGAMWMIRVLSGASKPKTNKHVKPYCANGVCVPSAHGCLTASDMDRIGQQKRGMLPEITRPIETHDHWNKSREWQAVGKKMQTTREDKHEREYLFPQEENPGTHL